MKAFALDELELPERNFRCIRVLMSKREKSYLALKAFRLFPSCWNFVTTLGGGPGRNFCTVFYFAAE